ncbi:hypothetical protein SODALDRAFT_354119 [Sodiomyces alkalinus F11]|uniref:Uncharacterized protein n=1 Tax=Sodiomyces alkalinus (strain CBS 110278 / VKM F-3762 / F11) TaxID=1314773 RepID=A0A3N2Q5F4_SODAK|nr:hypothetical protein SODALDRAFT_354119 [Sodiomyces alkalinus F11]ROT42001.1 hypothetical protein SODALDRAFT_354119 [Sodiomyces alkalinus F11]
MYVLTTPRFVVGGGLIYAGSDRASGGSSRRALGLAMAGAWTKKAQEAWLQIWKEFGIRNFWGGGGQDDEMTYPRMRFRRDARPLSWYLGRGTNGEVTPRQWSKKAKMPRLIPSIKDQRTKSLQIPMQWLQVFAQWSSAIELPKVQCRKVPNAGGRANVIPPGSLKTLIEMTSYGLITSCGSDSLVLIFLFSVSSTHLSASTTSSVNSPVNSPVFALQAITYCLGMALGIALGTASQPPAKQILIGSNPNQRRRRHTLVLLYDRAPGAFVLPRFDRTTRPYRSSTQAPEKKSKRKRKHAKGQNEMRSLDKVTIGIEWHPEYRE